MNEEQIKTLIKDNSTLTTILKIAADLNLADCWLCAGTIRNFIWNYVSNQDTEKFSSDIDIVFYDKNTSYEETLNIQKDLKIAYPNFDWELKNQVFMHTHNPNTEPYKNTRDAISKFPEKCTAIAARLINQEIELFCPFGLADNLNLIVQPTPFFLETKERQKIYNQRVTNKNWQKQWPNLTVITCSDT